MLYLTRRINESIQISDEITITVVRINDKQICLGIDAPRNITVMRRELLKNSVKKTKSLATDTTSANDEGTTTMDPEAGPD
jgi:carbon storage regulator